MATMTYLQAISSALRDELRADERVLLLGEDIGVFGGAFKVTDGFIDEFGPERVMDTPLAESAIVGCAIGAAVVGMRPVCEMQFSDFISCGFDQLVNVAGKTHYRLGLAVPITIRLPSGGGFSGGPFHSQNPESWLMHAPGIKVVAPSTAHDAKGLLHAAIRDPNPVCFMEHKNLYRRIKGEVPDGIYETPMTARVAREGSDLVVIAYGAMVHVALEATEDLDGASVEVLDLRSLVPLDEQAILESVARCSKVVVLDEANATCAAGAQVAALIAERGFEDLDGPVVRVATPDVPIPFSPPLEQAVLPGVDRVREAAVSSSPTETARLIDVTMPQMGVSVAEGTVVAWRLRVGDTVLADQTICEISTDKIDIEVPSPAGGVVAEILVEVGRTVPVGTVLARIASGEAAADPRVRTPPQAAPRLPTVARRPRRAPRAPHRPACWRPAAERCRQSPGAGAIPRSCSGSQRSMASTSQAWRAAAVTDAYASRTCWRLIASAESATTASRTSLNLHFTSRVRTAPSLQKPLPCRASRAAIADPPHDRRAHEALAAHGRHMHHVDRGRHESRPGGPRAARRDGAADRRARDDRGTA